MKFEFTQPEFLMAEIPIKDGSLNDHRLWVYHRLSLSLIEFICINDYDDFEFTNKQDYFTYEEETWFGVYVQNNCEATGNIENEVLKKAWEFLKSYLNWEDKNIDQSGKSKLN